MSFLFLLWICFGFRISCFEFTLIQNLNCTPNRTYGASLMSASSLLLDWSKPVLNSPSQAYPTAPLSSTSRSPTPASFSR